MNHKVRLPGAAFTPLSPLLIITAFSAYPDLPSDLGRTQAVNEVHHDPEISDEY
jgi:hypothetical protein